MGWSAALTEVVLGQVEKKVADLTVQLELSKSRGGGVLEDELSEKFEWLRSQQEQMLVVMTEAIREGKLGGGEAEPAEPVVPKQPPLHADAAATIQAVRVVCRQFCDETALGIMQQRC